MPAYQVNYHYKVLYKACDNSNDIRVLRSRYFYVPYIHALLRNRMDVYNSSITLTAHFDC